MLQGMVAIGIAIGAVIAAKWITLRQVGEGAAGGHHHGRRRDGHDLRHRPAAGAAMMVVMGAMAGFFVVPMNALLQHRGHILMGAGHSIAVQNFNENLSILIMTMWLVKLRHELNQRQRDDVAHLDDVAHH
jgi:LPLT family lysophospholipid transporter-like MFS transporter